MAESSTPEPPTIDECIKDLEQYPFSSDEEFIRGWAGLRKSLGATKDDVMLHYLRAKIFYFARLKNVQSMIPDLTSRLLQQISNKADKANDQPTSRDSLSTTDRDHSHVGSVEIVNHSELSHQDSVSGGELPSTDSSKLTLGAVVKLLNEGREIPGLEKLDIKPSQEVSPSSRIERPIKPWEVGCG